jgi:transposase
MHGHACECRAVSSRMFMRYRRLSVRRGPMRATVAIQTRVLTASWHMGTAGAFYNDPGPY